MPKKDGTYGDLVIKFDILFPQKLNDKQKDLLNQAFDENKFQIEWK
jgi:DnaJ-class molecular chaperone